MAHLQIRPAKITQCNICKKIGHYASQCTAKAPEKRTPRKQQLTTPGKYVTPRTRRVRHLKSESQQDESTEESVDAEAALCIKKLHDDWANSNLIRPSEFIPQTNQQIKKKHKRRILGRNNNQRWKPPMARGYRIATVVHKRTKNHGSDRQNGQ